jgi:hypothetical protein
MSFASMVRRVPTGALALGAIALGALAVAPSALVAQHVVGADVNALADGGDARQPLFFPSAALLSGGRLSLSLQAVGARERVRYPEGTSVSGTDTDALITSGSAAWGVTSWLTLGAYAAKAKADVTTQYAPLANVMGQLIPEPDLPPTRQGTRAGIAGDEVGVHGRIGLWKSSGGVTRLTATGRVYDRADAAVTTGVGVALQQRVGRVTLHVAPSAWFADGGSDAYEVDAATALAVGRGSAVMAELLHRGATAATNGDRPHITEVAGGVRHRFGRLALDVGVRHLASYEQPVRDASRASALLATHWLF